MCEEKVFCEECDYYFDGGQVHSGSSRIQLLAVSVPF